MQTDSRQTGHPAGTVLASPWRPLSTRQENRTRGKEGAGAGGRGGGRTAVKGEKHWLKWRGAITDWTGNESDEYTPETPKTGPINVTDAPSPGSPLRSVAVLHLSLIHI